MLTHLSIENYALIDALDIDFEKGFSVITGETGAGKSIILGALGLVLGNRNQQNTAKDTTKKTIVEAHFSINSYDLEVFFETEDLDYQKNSIIRRVLLPSGKSRAFVNDIPVKVTTLQKLSEKLIDIHGQNNSAMLNETAFQFFLLDSICENEELLEKYRLQLSEYRAKQKQLAAITTLKTQNEKEQDYLQHLYEELVNANLKEGEQAALEQQMQVGEHQETIFQLLTENQILIENEATGINAQVYMLIKNTSELSNFDKTYQNYLKRLEQIKIELTDIGSDFTEKIDGTTTVEINIQKIEDRLKILWDLQRKHGANHSDDLIAIKDEIGRKLSRIKDDDGTIKRLKTELSNLEESLDMIAKMLLKRRLESVSPTVEKLESTLAQLGMKKARFQIDLTQKEDFDHYGRNHLSIKMATNEGSCPETLKKISGGERARVMLAMKWLLSEKAHLPTIIFDEIDTGVSGEIALKMAEMMQAMGKNMQVFALTHLPQIAAKGTTHYKVEKQSKDGTTKSRLLKLDTEKRIKNIAQMVSGNNPQQAAIQHAKDLLGV